MTQIMDAYRLIAQQRYQQKMERDQQERERVEEELREKEKWLEEQNNELEKMYTLLQEWDELIPELHKDPFLILMLLVSKAEVFVPIMKKNDIMFHIEERTIALVHQLNDIQEKQHSTIDEVRMLQDIMKQILCLSKVDVHIETMDTEGDLDMARKMYEDDSVMEATRLAEQLRMEDEMNLLNRMAQPPVQDQMNLPICSFTKRIGLTIPELRELSRQHGLKTTGSKQELCQRLEQGRLVQIVY